MTGGDSTDVTGAHRAFVAAATGAGWIFVATAACAGWTFVATAAACNGAGIFCWLTSSPVISEVDAVVEDIDVTFVVVVVEDEVCVDVSVVVVVSVSSSSSSSALFSELNVADFGFSRGTLPDFFSIFVIAAEGTCCAGSC